MNVQRRDGIVDIFIPGRRAACRCKHGKTWLEGDRTESWGGDACGECVTAWQEESRRYVAARFN